MKSTLIKLQNAIDQELETKRNQVLSLLLVLVVGAWAAGERSCFSVLPDGCNILDNSSTRKYMNEMCS